MAHPFDAVVAHLEAGGKAHLSWLIYAQFGSGGLRAWQGRGDITSGGFVWVGTSGTVELKDIAIEQGFTASKVDISLSGVDSTFVTLAHNAKADVQNRPIAIYLQAFDQLWQPVGDPVAVWAGLMDRMQFSGDADGALITLTCESPFVTRNRPRGAYYTAADQDIRAPGDRGLEFVSVLEDKNVDQPVLPE